jgi:hypothetical protein
MATTDRSTVVGVFQDWGWAERAIDELHHAGFTDREIGILTPGGLVAPALTPTGVLEKNAGDAAVRGAISGGTIGALAGAVATGLIPGVGPVIAGGLLLGILGGAAAGAALGTFAAPFIALGVSEDEARHYHDQFAAGRTILVVRAGDRAAEAREILRRFEGAVREDLPAPVAGQAP